MYPVFLSVLIILLAMAMLLPSTIRGMRQRRAIRERAAVRELDYRGEVVGKSPHAADPDFDLVVRCDDGTTITASLPVAFDSRFALGSRVVKRADHLWPEAAD